MATRCCCPSKAYLPVEGPSPHVKHIQCPDGHGLFRFGKNLEKGRQRPMVSQTAHQNIGKDVQAIYQAKLLKNHGAA